MSDLAAGNSRSFSFASFVLIPERQLLLEGGVPVRIGGRALDILTALVERHGELVSKDELFSRVWPDTVVEEANLKVNMAALRRVLGDGSRGMQFIATVVGRGYRFVVPVTSSDRGEPAIEPRAAPKRRHNLPANTARIFGRDEQIEGMRRDLDESRLLSIVGAGGVGKTTVGLAVAAHAVESYADGVWFVELAPLKDPALVPSAIATTLGFRAQSASLLAALCEFLRDQELLLVLDSCEHLIDAVAACAHRILAEAPRVRLLVTSRESLRVSGERVRRLSGLPTPPASPVLSAAKALEFPAIQLFVDRAAEKLESFRLSDADAPVVSEICRKLDGLALAIELAATRIDAFGLTGLQRQLDDRLSLLHGHRTSVERHRTLTATIDWSYELLPESERRLMRRLSTFVGSFSLRSACAVANGADGGHGKVVEELANLVAKSLVVVEAGDVEVQYRQLDTTRSYALDKLAANGEIDDARLRHAQHFLELSELAARERDRVPRAEWLSRHAHPIDDVRAALTWAWNTPERADLAVRLTVATIPSWKQLSLVEECRTAAAVALDERYRAHRTEQDDLILNLTLGASVLHTRGPLLLVKTCLTNALELAEKLHDTSAQLECLRGLSEYELWTGDSRSALGVAEKIRALSAQGEEKRRGDADAPTGSALSFLGDLAASRQHLESIVNRPLTHHAFTDSTRFDFDQRLTARGTLATVLWLQGFPEQALEMARRQREEAEASQSAVSLCYALLHGSAIVSLYVRDLEAADRFFDQGVKHATKHDLTVWRAMATCSRGRWALDSGKPLDLDEYRNALSELHAGGFRMRYANYLTNYGDALTRRGDFAEGLAYIDEAIALSRDRGQFLGVPEMLRIKGDAFRARGERERDKAVECYLESIECARGLGALSWELRSATSLVELWREAGGNDHAEVTLSAAFAQFREGFETGDLKRARVLLRR